MPAIPTTYTNPTGKQNLFTSLNNWLTTNVPAGATFTYSFVQEAQPAKFPAVEVVEFNYFQPGNTAFGKYLFPGATGAQKSEGTKSAAMIQITIRDSAKRSTSAKKNIYQIRDRIVHALRNAGISRDSDDIEIAPAIAVLDYDNAGAPTGIIARVPVEDDNSILERYYAPTPETPDIHQYELLVRLEWYEMSA